MFGPKNKKMQMLISGNGEKIIGEVTKETVKDILKYLFFFQ